MWLEPTHCCTHEYVVSHHDDELTDLISHASTAMHIEVRLHFLKNHKGVHTTTPWIPTEENVVDILTKPLMRVKFAKLRAGLFYYDDPLFCKSGTVLVYESLISVMMMHRCMLICDNTMVD